MAELKDKPKDFTLKNNSVKREVKSGAADRIEVEIGDAEQPDFKPQFKIKRWDNEANFSMRAEEDPTATVVIEDGKVKYKAKDYEVHQYEKPEMGEDGGFEFEWVLDKKPKSNVFTATIQHKELDFFYQPEITDEEAQQQIDKGIKLSLEQVKFKMRPENVVGSYAVYHKTKRDNVAGRKEYKTGKAFHIYRPEAVDADGLKTWCELNIDEVAGVLSVTVPFEYLDNAKYPVRVDPTFGYTSAGASEDFQGFGDSQHSKYSATAGELVSMSYHGYYDGGGTTPALSAIWETGATPASPSTDSVPLTNGATDSFSISSTKQWYTATFSTNPTVSATDYFLGTLVGSGSYMWMSYDATGNDGVRGSLDSSNITNLAGATGNDITTSIYATYTEAAATNNPARRQHLMLM